MADDVYKTGKCLCGQVQYKFLLKEQYQSFGYCHCRECRRQYGHYAAFTGIKSQDFKIIKDDSLKWYNSSEFVKRGFCSGCGTPMIFKDARQEEYFVSVGTIDDDSVMKGKTHIFVDEKGGHYEILDNHIQYCGDPWSNPLEPPTDEDLRKARVK